MNSNQPEEDKLREVLVSHFDDEALKKSSNDDLKIYGLTSSLLKPLRDPTPTPCFRQRGSRHSYSETRAPAHPH